VRDVAHGSGLRWLSPLRGFGPPVPDPDGDIIELVVLPQQASPIYCESAYIEISGIKIPVQPVQTLQTNEISFTSSCRFYSRTCERLILFVVFLDILRQ